MTYDFWQGNKHPRFRLLFKAGSDFPISELGDPMEHANSQWFAANRADVVQFPGLRRHKRYVAGAMAIKMIFAFFWIKLQSAQKTAGARRRILTPGGCAQGIKNPIVGGVA